MSKAKPKVKVVVERISGVRIETTRNGFKVTASSGVIRSGDCFYFSELAIPAQNWIGIDAGKNQQANPVKRDRPSGEYVFADFASLSAWLKKYLKHGGGVEA